MHEERGAAAEGWGTAEAGQLRVERKQRKEILEFGRGSNGDRPGAGGRTILVPGRIGRDGEIGAIGEMRGGRGGVLVVDHLISRRGIGEAAVLEIEKAGFAIGGWSVAIRGIHGQEQHDQQEDAAGALSAQERRSGGVVELGGGHFRWVGRADGGKVQLSYFPAMMIS
jgi:hypothetical protein